ncbi:MAG: hypothetical protein GY898_23065 [Proteobacteria bacterium]|nr:hypothetical protein [Pseudomonadota bacterium]
MAPATTTTNREEGNNMKITTKQILLAVGAALVFAYIVLPLVEFLARA